NCGPYCTLGQGYDCFHYPTNAIRFRGIGALPSPQVVRVPSLTEVYAFKLILSNRGTVGTACSGCGIGACIELNVIELQQSPSNSQPCERTVIFNPSTRSRVTWNGGVAGCDAVTRTGDRTWGTIKSLYR